jgi:hypothetical protein
MLIGIVIAIATATAAMARGTGRARLDRSAQRRVSPEGRRR